MTVNFERVMFYPSFLSLVSRVFVEKSKPAETITCLDLVIISHYRVVSQSFNWRERKRVPKVRVDLQGVQS